MRQLLILALICYSVVAKCPIGSVYSKDYDMCYLVSSMNSLWPTAEGVCNVLGGHLASVHSKNQSDYILSLVSNASTYDLMSYDKIMSIWIGVSSAQNKWTNTDGSPVDYSAFPGVCDFGWASEGSHCIQTDTEPKSWQEARNICGNKNAFIANDLNDDQHNSLLQSGGGSYFWLGLYNRGSGYFWDQGPGNAPIPLNQSNQYWVGGGAAPAYDPKKQCVFFDGTQEVNTWTLGSCNQMLYTICQKDRYDQNNAPNQKTYIQMSTNGSSAGQWVLSNYEDQTNYFVCELPQCGSDGSPPASLISPNTKVPGIVYGNMTHAWYMNNDAIAVSVSMAEPLCAKMGAHLPSVGNAFKNAELLNIIWSTSMRDITLGYKKSGGKWSWTDGNTATYTNWGNNNEPNAKYSSATFSGPGSDAGFWESTAENGWNNVLCEISPATRSGWC